MLHTSPAKLSENQRVLEQNLIQHNQILLQDFFPGAGLRLRCSPKGEDSATPAGFAVPFSAFGFFFSLLERCSLFAMSVSTKDRFGRKYPNAKA